MNTTIDTFTPVNQPEYHNHFWNYLMGKEDNKKILDLGRKTTGAYVMPTTSSKKFEDKLNAESLFRQLATYHYAPNGPSSILAKVNTDSAEWVGPGGAINAYDAINDFSTYKLNDHKLAVIMQLDASFLHDNHNIFESYFTDRLVKDFAHAEERGFINGTGEDMPTGILAEDGGAEVGVTADAITFENVVKLFFSAIRTLRERFFETDQIGYLAFELLDGKLIRPEAIKVMQMTA